MGGVGCDNMTVILACFLQRDSYRELAQRCSRNHFQIPKSPYAPFPSLHSTLPDREGKISELPIMQESPLLTSNLAGMEVAIRDQSLEGEGSQVNQEDSEEEEAGVYNDYELDVPPIETTV